MYDNHALITLQHVIVDKITLFSIYYSIKFCSSCYSIFTARFDFEMICLFPKLSLHTTPLLTPNVVNDAKQIHASSKLTTPLRQATLRFVCQLRCFKSSLRLFFYFSATLKKLYFLSKLINKSKTSTRTLGYRCSVFVIFLKAFKISSKK